MNNLHETSQSSLLAYIEEAEFFFRIGMVNLGNEKTRALIEGLLEIAPKLANKHIKELNVVLNDLMRCQEREDWTALADTARYDLVKIISSLEIINE